PWGGASMVVPMWPGAAPSVVTGGAVPAARSVEQSRQGAFPGSVEFVEPEPGDALNVQRSGLGVGDADLAPRQAAGAAHFGELQFLGAAYRHQYPARGFGEQLHERVAVRVEHDPGAALADQGGFDEGLCESTVGEVVCCREHPFPGTRGEDLTQQSLPGEVRCGWSAAEVLVRQLAPARPGELVVGVAEQEQ